MAPETPAHLLGDPDLPDGRVDALLTAGIQSIERPHTRRRWARQLAREHDVHRVPLRQSRKSTLRPFYRYAAAAAAILLILFAVLLEPSTGGTDLLAQELELIEVINTRSIGQHLSQERADFYTAFQRSEFSDAVRIGLRIAEDADCSGQDLLNLGLVQLQALDHTGAGRTFERLLARDPLYHVEANFYAGLSALQDGRVESGKAYLRRIDAETSGRYYRRAAALLAAEW